MRYVIRRYVGLRPIGEPEHTVLWEDAQVIASSWANTGRYDDEIQNESSGDTLDYFPAVSSDELDN